MENKLNYFIGVDLGGTQIKVGIINNNAEVIIFNSTPTQAELGNEVIINNIIKLINKSLKQAKLTFSNITAVGVAVPGAVDSKRGIAMCSHNLNFNNFNIAETLEQKLSLPVTILNDANAACLAEYHFGLNRKYQNMLTITLGTGVGGGAIINGNLLQDSYGLGSEFGHTSINFNGQECPCGMRGCVEQYVSATALKRKTIQKMEQNLNSLMWEVKDLSNVTAKLPFDYYSKDQTAKQIVDEYIELLSISLANFCNILRPEVIVLAGGVALEGEALTAPVEKLLNKKLFANTKSPIIKVLASNLNGTSGVLGAVCRYLI